MRLLVDTNLLLRLIEPEHAQHETAAEALASLDALGYLKVLLPQVVYEFWAVATRPVDVNGLGLTNTEVLSILEGVMATVHLCAMNEPSMSAGGNWLPTTT
jgi:predicted nucleic acid-binding protein